MMHTHTHSHTHIHTHQESSKIVVYIKLLGLHQVDFFFVCGFIYSFIHSFTNTLLLQADVSGYSTGKHFFFFTSPHY